MLGVIVALRADNKNLRLAKGAIALAAFLLPFSMLWSADSFEPWEVVLILLGAISCLVLLRMARGEQPPVGIGGTAAMLAGFATYLAASILVWLKGADLEGKVLLVVFLAAYSHVIWANLPSRTGKVGNDA